jgi:hypothetical protein
MMSDSQSVPALDGRVVVVTDGTRSCWAVSVTGATGESALDSSGLVPAPTPTFERYRGAWSAIIARWQPSRFATCPTLCTASTRFAPLPLA